MNNKNRLLIISFGLGLFLIILIVASLIGLKAQAETKLISPVSKITQNKSAQPDKSISQYITLSQEFLNQARLLANNNPNQTDEQKQAIIEKIERALDVINQGVQAYPLDDRVYSQRASIYQSLTSFLPEAVKFAINDLVQATKINQKNPDYYLRLADLYQKTGDFENAASAYFNAYRLAPANSQTLFNLARALEKSGQIDKAIRYYDKLITLLPADDQNLEALQKQKANLEALLVNSNLEQLSEPGMEMVPQKPTNGSQPILGTEELPLEQATIASKIIIASPEEKSTLSADTGEVSTNAKTGSGILKAGEREVTIKNNHVANDKQIIIVPNGNIQNKVLYLMAKKAPSTSLGQDGWFKVAIDEPINKDVEFNWWIID
jgi:tetratricopeptide (TPR) repeat protein